MKVQLPPLDFRQAIALVIALEKRHQKLATLHQTEAVRRANAVTEELQAIVDAAVLEGMK
jgi:hypothetical protein